MVTTGHAHQDIPLACELTAISADERAGHVTQAAHLFGTIVQERRALPDGYAFRFSADAYPLLVAFIANERLCCPFFHFVLEIAPAGGPIWLHITGSDGVKEFIQSEFMGEERE